MSLRRRGNEDFGLYFSLLLHSSLWLAGSIVQMQPDYREQRCVIEMAYRRPLWGHGTEQRSAENESV
jgi:hypothetical protein